MSQRPPTTRILAASVALAAGLAGALTVQAPAAAQQTIGYPEFTGGDAVPPEPAPYTVDGMMPVMFAAEADGTDFWMDRLLAREGADPAGDQWLMTRGRALLMRVHDPDVIGFGGEFAYYDPYFDRASNTDGFTVNIGDGDFTEVAAERRQTPSHWTSVHEGGDLTAEVQKFITDANVAVANVTVTNDGPTATVPLRVESDFAWQAEGDELTGVLDVQNSRSERLTTVFPRLSGTGLAPEDGALTGELQLAQGESATFKVQLGMIAEEIPASRTEYDHYRAVAAGDAFAEHVQTYNQWWADNLPYFDFPDEAHKKFVYYRWWLMRYNYLDADIPGNDFQFPTSIEGVTGYNNAIALTVPMFIDDLKYLRDPAYSYGPWVSTGESSGGGRFMDNPGDPENWSNSYTQYISEAAWRSYQIHGGPVDIAENLARYAEGDVKGQLETFDSDDNGLIEYDWGAMTGNDADAVSFHWRDGNLDRAESAYQYSGALAAAEAYELAGDTAKAEEMRGLAQTIADAITDVLWNPETELFEHVHVESGDHVPWKEINNYYPFSVGAVPNEAPYTEALRLFADPAEYPVFPFYTANQADKAEAAEQGNPGSNNFSQINSTVQFRLFSSVLRDYDTDAITTEDYKKLLYWNAWSTYIDGDTAWPDSNEFWADWNPGAESIDYRSWIHHTTLGSSIWTYVEDVAGLRPRTDDRIELSPIDIGWDHFTVNNLRYRDADLTIVWDEPGDGTVHYPGVPEGYSVYIDGSRAFTLDSLVPAVWDPDTGKVKFTEGGRVLKSYKMKDLSAPEDVALDGRVVDVFAKAGADLEGDAPNLAAGQTATASHTAAGSATAAAVDGATWSDPIWSSEGSGNETDWYEVELDQATEVDEVRLYFYRDRSATGLAEPAVYQIQYHDGTGWVTVEDQAKTPAIPQANYNLVQFPGVSTDRIRVLVDHQDAHATGLKEVQVMSTGHDADPPDNTAPYALARQDLAFRQPMQALLTGTVKDDGLPLEGSLTAQWSQVDGPGDVVFEDSAASSTIATFTEPGTYALKLDAGDGAADSESTVTVEIAEPDDRTNAALFATATASYTSPWENAAAVNDGIDPPRSNDGTNPRWGTWPETGEQWVQLEWAAPVRLDASDMYFFDDGGGVLAPAEWRLQYRDGDQWADVEPEGAYGTATDQYNQVAFDPVTTTALRAVLQSGGASVGVLEWKAFAEAPESVRPVHQPTTAGTVPTLPATATCVYADGTRVDLPVVWGPITDEDVAQPATAFDVGGLVTGLVLPAQATVHVRLHDQVEVTALETEAVTTTAGTAPSLPPTVTAVYNDGSKDNVSTAVTWEDIDPSQYGAPGTFTVQGAVAGTSLRAQATVTVT
ncbi:Ig-like domain-containing protein [Glycomyces harbinensis]|uniref:Ig-like domain (Group 4) n=1 Tax=Glycomyces harbinensis TaxID=58114 RepID=A0A1G6X8G6_9ACTN|nr:Ig-like domain-containing protein [Glycomyces harbinensis]SDD74401.1 Ig-like domain (group 4) [Glycomyces harbinensis]